LGGLIFFLINGIYFTSLKINNYINILKLIII
jgi:hypothetical protein